MMRMPVIYMRLITSDWKQNKVNQNLHLLLRKKVAFVMRKNYAVVEGLFGDSSSLFQHYTRLLC